jgi:Chaperone of endosialidase
MRLKSTLFLFLCFCAEITFSQSITIVPTNIASPAKGTVDFNDNTNQLQYWNGTVWIPITNAASGTGWALNGVNINNNNTGNVGIGTSTPLSPLHIKGNNEAFRIEGTSPFMAFYSNTGVQKTFVQNSGDDAYLGTSTGNSNGKIYFYLKDSEKMTILPSGNVGINSNNPTNKLQIGSVGSTGFSTNDFAVGNGTNAMAIFQTNAATLLGSSTDIVLKPRNNGTGYLGINIDNPTNKLQIGSMGATGFAGNDFALGNGTEAFGIYQTNTETQLAASKNIILKPSNGNGRVGINTTTPRAPLDVATTSTATALSSYYSYLYGNSWTYGIAQINTPPQTIGQASIVTTGGIYSTYFAAFSDSRIKNIISVSNSAKDLETVKALEITDYTMKDKVQQGNKIYKKVIAQQVEKFYPQAVNKFTDVVPDIYTLAEKTVFDEECKILTVSLSNSYQIKIGEKIEFIHEKEGKIKAEVVAVSGNSFTVKDWEYATNKIFVYGREVDDFRTVDYEAISMLGISAIQELAKKNEELASEIKKLKANNQQLNTRLETIENLMFKSQNGK